MSEKNEKPSKKQEPKNLPTSPVTNDTVDTTEKIIVNAPVVDTIDQAGPVDTSGENNESNDEKGTDLKEEVIVFSKQVSTTEKEHYETIIKANKKAIASLRAEAIELRSQIKEFEDKCSKKCEA